MARGEWTPGEDKVLAGFYMRFVSAARRLIEGGPRGIVAIPVKANWGPVKEVVSITGENNLISTYGSETEGGFTAYNAISLALLGGPSKVISYRITDGTEKKATIVLKNGESEAEDAVKLETIYPTERNFNVTVRESLEGNAQELILFEGTRLLETFTFETVDELVSKINDSSEYLEATKISDGPLAIVSNEALKDGNAGIGDITNQDYIDALVAIEAKTFNAFALDTAHDSDLRASVVSWVKRLRSQGKRILGYIGGTAEEDQDQDGSNTRSKSINHEGIINVTVGVEYNGKHYPSGEAAAYVAGRASGQELSESLTFASTPFTDVIPALTPEQRAEAVQSGSFVFFEDDGEVKCERGINTLTNYGANQSESWSKIKLTRLRDSIDTDLSTTANDQYVGKLLNNADGQAALLSAIKAYFETLAPDLIEPDFIVQPNAELMENAKKDQFFWEYYVTDVDSMEEIYGTGYHQ